MQIFEIQCIVESQVWLFSFGMEGVYGPLPSSCHAKSKLYCGPNGPTASIFHEI